MAKYSITLDMQNLGRGGEIDVPGLGVLHNGRTYELDDEQVEAFRQAFATTVVDADGVYSRELGPTPLQANWPPGITVETVRTDGYSSTRENEPEDTTDTTGGDE